MILFTTGAHVGKLVVDLDIFENTSITETFSKSFDSSIMCPNIHL